jgi:hypothetical protein
MKKSNLKNICYVLIFAAIVVACSNGQKKQNDPQNEPKNSPELCEHVKTILQNEIGGKISQDSTTIFFPVKDSKEAFKRAQNLAIKMNATIVAEKNDTLCYDLPEENTSIQIIEKKEDECLYVVFRLLINCEDYPVKEIHYTSLKSYNGL